MIVAHVDGLFVDSTADVPSADPLVHGISFFKQLTYGAPDTVMLTCEYRSRGLQQWLGQFGITSSWLMAYEDMTADRRLDEMMSFVGSKFTTIGLFVGATVYDCGMLAARGIPTVQFRRPQQVFDWGPEPGEAWSREHTGAERYLVDHLAADESSL